MRYQKFVIENYRAIRGPLTINVDKDRLIPIIGVNESGKTTILHAIFAFDQVNDTTYGGQHLKDIENLYAISSSGIPFVSASVSTTRVDLEEILDEILGETEDASDEAFALYLVSLLDAVSTLPLSFEIVRCLAPLEYQLPTSSFPEESHNSRLASQLVRRLPWVLYFDDFRSSVPDRIQIDQPNSEWTAIVEQLFIQTDEHFSVHKLVDMEARNRKSVIAKVNGHLNDTLTREWQKFRLDKIEPLKLSIEFEVDTEIVEKTVRIDPPSAPAASPSAQTTPVSASSPGPTQAPQTKKVFETVKHAFLKFDIIETDSRGDDHYFFIRDRSKGFFWFFNFVMRLEFNPKVVEEGTVYLLDEPGSYLHASAQSKLCSKLKPYPKRTRSSIARTHTTS